MSTTLAALARRRMNYPPLHCSRCGAELGPADVTAESGPGLAGRAA
jgi:hypothetical protein